MSYTLSSCLSDTNRKSSRTLIFLSYTLSSCLSDNSTTKHYFVDLCLATVAIIFPLLFWQRTNAKLNSQRHEFFHSWYFVIFKVIYDLGYITLYKFETKQKARTLSFMSDEKRLNYPPLCARSKPLERIEGASKTLLGQYQYRIIL